MTKDTRATLKLKPEVRDCLRVVKAKKKCDSYDEVILLLIEESKQYHLMLEQQNILKR